MLPPTGSSDSHTPCTSTASTMMSSTIQLCGLDIPAEVVATMVNFCPRRVDVERVGLTCKALQTLVNNRHLVPCKPWPTKCPFPKVVKSCVFSSDGSRVALLIPHMSGGLGLQVWDVHQGLLLEDHVNNVRGMKPQFSNDNSLLVVSDQGPMGYFRPYALRVWKLPTSTTKSTAFGSQVDTFCVSSERFLMDAPVTSEAFGRTTMTTSEHATTTTTELYFTEIVSASWDRNRCFPDVKMCNIHIVQSNTSDNNNNNNNNNTTKIEISQPILIINNNETLTADTVQVAATHAMRRFGRLAHHEHFNLLAFVYRDELNRLMLRLYRQQTLVSQWPMGHICQDSDVADMRFNPGGQSLIMAHDNVGISVLDIPTAMASDDSPMSTTATPRFIPIPGGLLFREISFVPHGRHQSNGRHQCQAAIFYTASPPSPGSQPTLPSYHRDRLCIVDLPSGDILKLDVWAEGAWKTIMTTITTTGQ